MLLQTVQWERVDNEVHLFPWGFYRLVLSVCLSKLDFPRQTSRLECKYRLCANEEPILRDRFSPN